jgi:hypothetical protein
VMMFVGEVVSVIDRILILFPQYKSYGAGVFCSCWNSYSIKLLTCPLLEDFVSLSGHPPQWASRNCPLLEDLVSNGL